MKSSRAPPPSRVAVEDLPGTEALADPDGPLPLLTFPPKARPLPPAKAQERSTIKEAIIRWLEQSL